MYVETGRKEGNKIGRKERNRHDRMNVHRTDIQ
jgi:hypothetical protein